METPSVNHAGTPRWGWAVVALFLAIVMAVAAPQLPAGICFDDSGDLQLSSATLGIAHPPGYPGYASIGYLLTRLPGVEPAYVITLACCAAGLAGLLVAVLWQVRLGASIWLAVALGLALAAHPRYWTNLRAPEVYMPTLALTAGSAWLLLGYAGRGKAPGLVLAVFLYGVALGNRPPVLFAAPFFLMAWNHARRRWKPSTREGLKTLSWMVPLALAPTAYSFGYIYFRDRPDVCYNYIDHHNEETGALPESTEGTRAKLYRTVWQLTGQQFREYMGDSWKGVLGKARWLETQITYLNPVTDAVAFVFAVFDAEPPESDWYARIDVYSFVLLSLIGLWIAFRRCVMSGWLLLGMMVSCTAFVLAYQVYGQAADLLPLIFAQAVALGALGSKLFPVRGHPLREVFALLLALAAAGSFVANLPSRPIGSTGVDAGEFLREVDLATFPGPAVICANWTKSVPLRYAQCVQHHRSDLDIITSGPELWINTARKAGKTPVYVASPLDPLGPCTREPFRNIHRLYCPPLETP